MPCNKSLHRQPAAPAAISLLADIIFSSAGCHRLCTSVYCKMLFRFNLSHTEQPDYFLSANTPPFFGFIFDRWCFVTLRLFSHLQYNSQNVIRKEEQSLFIEATRNKPENRVVCQFRSYKRKKAGTDSKNPK